MQIKKNEYKILWEQSKKNKYLVVDQFESSRGFAIDENWFYKLALMTQVVLKDKDICYQHGRLLYSELSSYISKNGDGTYTVLETGTARGFSAMCMARALSDRAASGKIITFDVLPHDTKMYWNCIADSEGPSSRKELLIEYKQYIEDYMIFVQGDSRMQLGKISVPRVNFAFLDGAHTYAYVLNEFSFIKDKQKLGDIIFFDDYTPRHFPGVVRAVDEICKK